MKHRFFMRRAVQATLVVCAAGLTPLAAAQDYPAKSITFIVPYAAGGSGDIRGRQIGQKLASILGKPVIIEKALESESDQALKPAPEQDLGPAVWVESLEKR